MQIFWKINQVRWIKVFIQIKVTLTRKIKLNAKISTENNKICS